MRLNATWIIVGAAVAVLVAYNYLVKPMQSSAAAPTPTIQSGGDTNTGVQVLPPVVLPPNQALVTEVNNIANGIIAGANTTSTTTQPDYTVSPLVATPVVNNPISAVSSSSGTNEVASELPFIQQHGQYAYQFPDLHVVGTNTPPDQYLALYPTAKLIYSPVATTANIAAPSYATNALSSGAPY